MKLGLRFPSVPRDVDKDLFASHNSGSSQKKRRPSLSDLLLCLISIPKIPLDSEPTKPSLLYHELISDVGVPKPVPTQKVGAAHGDGMSVNGVAGPSALPVARAYSNPPAFDSPKIPHLISKQIYPICVEGKG